MIHQSANALTVTHHITITHLFLGVVLLDTASLQHKAFHSLLFSSFPLVLVCLLLSSSLGEHLFRFENDTGGQMLTHLTPELIKLHNESVLSEIIFLHSKFTLKYGNCPRLWKTENYAIAVTIQYTPCARIYSPI